MFDNLQRIQGYDEQGGKTVAFNTRDVALLDAAWSGNNKALRAHLLGPFWRVIEISMPSTDAAVRQCERDDFRRRVEQTDYFVPAGQKFLGRKVTPNRLHWDDHKTI